MIIPREVDVMGIPYTVEEVDVVDRSGMNWGVINFEEQTIRIDKALADEKKKQVFIHELVHAILNNIGQDTWNHDETAVQSFAAALYQVLETQGIADFKASELVKELSKRKGVTKEVAEAYQDKTVSVNDPAVILTVLNDTPFLAGRSTTTSCIFDVSLATTDILSV